MKELPGKNWSKELGIPESLPRVEELYGQVYSKKSDPELRRRGRENIVASLYVLVSHELDKPVQYSDVAEYVDESKSSLYQLARWIVVELGLDRELLIPPAPEKWLWNVDIVDEIKVEATEIIEEAPGIVTSQKAPLSIAAGAVYLANSKSQKDVAEIFGTTHTTVRQAARQLET